MSSEAAISNTSFACFCGVGLGGSGPLLRPSGSPGGLAMACPAAVGSRDSAKAARLLRGQRADSTAAHSAERQNRRSLESEPVMRQLHLFVGAMSCRRCVREVTARLRDVPGVETVSASSGDRVVRLSGSMQLI